MDIKKLTQYAPRSILSTLAQDHRNALLSRREFLSHATAFGVSAPLLYQSLGIAPSYAQDLVAPRAGSLRISMAVIDLTDPRLFEWPEQGNILRGFMDYLVIAAPDGSLLPSLAKSWSANEDASDYIIELRQDVTWSDGRALTAEDVAENFAAWADGTVAGNSMAVRLTCLQDPNTRQLRGDAVEILDDHHLRLRLAFPDITLMHSLADYPAAIQPRDHIGRNPLDHGIGTGAYRLEAFEPRQKAVLVRDPSLDTWRQAFLDKVEFLDFGIDPLNAVHAARADEIDMTYESLGDFIEPFIALGWQESQTQSSASLVLRPNQKAEIEGITPYADAKLRRALALAVRNDVLLELGHGNRGQIADNHHVAPIQPDYAESPLGSADPDAARQLMAETGLQNFIHEIVSVDGDWRTDTTAALVAQLNDAGIPARHKIVPSDQYWAGWKDFAFSATNWGSRELGIQTLALAYHSQAAWNETGYANPEFDRLLEKALGQVQATERKSTMLALERMLQKDGVIIQPYWRQLYRHFKPGVLNGEMTPNQVIDPHKLALAG